MIVEILDYVQIDMNIRRIFVVIIIFAILVGQSFCKAGGVDGEVTRSFMVMSIFLQKKDWFFKIITSRD